jgi:3-hydroxy-9,10-secoandrosta-1,3,5(10)-triene-9,17-dione monooxygenase
MLSTAASIERAEGLVETLAHSADDGERLRRLPEATIRALDESDLWRLVVPTSYGGHGLGIEALANVTRVLAQGCPASAWVISFLVMHNWLLTKFAAETLAEVFPADRPYSHTAAPLAPTGTAIRVDGGFRIDGRWEWATGIEHAHWVMVHAVQREPEFTAWFVLVPIAEVEVEDLWHTSGMRATGSNVVHIRDVFVPEHRAVSAVSLRAPSMAVDGNSMAALPLSPVLCTVAAAPALGAAEAAVVYFKRNIERRVLAYSPGDKAREQPLVQARLGSVMASLAAARALWDQSVARLVTVSPDHEMSLDDRAQIRLAASFVVRTSRDILTAIGDGVGASAYFADSPFQRWQRDVETLKGHVVFDWDRTTELAGRIALGFDPRPTDMV